MRHNTQARRMRGGRNHGTGHSSNQQRRGFHNKNKVFDSNGPDVRIRGTAFQIVEKYATLAKDAHATGDWVLAESYLQHAEHYQRMINEWGVEEAAEAVAYSETSYDRFDANQQQPVVTIASSDVEEDLGLPSSIIGARKQEMAEA